MLGAGGAAMVLGMGGCSHGAGGGGWSHGAIGDVRSGGAAHDAGGVLGVGGAATVCWGCRQAGLALCDVGAGVPGSGSSAVSPPTPDRAIVGQLTSA